MSNVGYATLSVIPSLRGMDAQVQQQLVGKMSGVGSAAGASAGRGFASGLATSAWKSVDSFGSKINTTIAGAMKKGVLAGSAAFTGVAGFALWGGLGRVLDTEDATVQLRRMGLAVDEVDFLLDQVDKTFQGTPFANPDGFNISSQLYASGIGLERIPKILGTIADAASHGNVPLDQMSSIFTRVAAQGKVQGDEFARLADAGIPLKLIADQMGLTVQQMLKLGSEGKITADMFFEAVGAVEMFEGAAKAAGDTTRGAWSNVLTALRKLGADFLGPLFGENGHVVTGLKGVLAWLKSLSPAVKELGQSFADWLVPAVKEVVGAFVAFGNAWKYADGDITSSGLPGFAERTAYVLRDLTTAWAFFVDGFKSGRAFTDAGSPIIEGFGDLYTKASQLGAWFKENREMVSRWVAALGPGVATGLAFASMLNAVKVAVLALIKFSPVGLIMLAATAFAYAWQNSEKFREVVTGAFSAVRDAIGPLVERLTVDIPKAFAAVAAFVAPIVERVRGFIDSLVGGGGRISEGASAWMGTLTGAWEKVQAVAERVWPQIQQVLATFFEHLRTVWGPVVTSFVAMLRSGFNRAREIVLAIVEVLSDVWERHGEKLRAALQQYWEYIQRSFQRIAEIVKSVIDTIRAIFDGDWAAAWASLKNAAAGVWDQIVDLVKTAVGVLGNVLPAWWDAVKGILSRAWSAISDDAETAWEGIKNIASTVLDAVVEFLKSLPGKALDALQTLAPKLWELAKAGFGKLKDAGGWVWDNALWPFLKSLPGLIVGALSRLGLWLLVVGAAAFGKFKEAMSTVWQDVIKPWLEDLPSKIPGYLTSLSTTLWNTAKYAFEVFKGAAAWVWEWVIKPWLEDLPGNVLTALSALGGFLLGLASSAFALLVSGAKIVWTTLIWPWLTALPGNMVAAIGSLAGALFYAGADFVQSLINGIDSKLEPLANIVNSVRRLVGLAPDASTTGMVAATNSAIYGGSGGLGPSLALSGVGAIHTTKQTPTGKKHSGGLIPGSGHDESLWMLKGGELVLTRSHQLRMASLLFEGRRNSTTGDAGGTSGGISIGELNVGSRRDLPDVHAELNAIAFHVKHGTASLAGVA